MTRTVSGALERAFDHATGPRGATPQNRRRRDDPDAPKLSRFLRQAIRSRAAFSRLRSLVTSGPLGFNPADEQPLFESSVSARDRPSAPRLLLSRAAGCGLRRFGN